MIPSTTNNIPGRYHDSMIHDPRQNNVDTTAATTMRRPFAPRRLGPLEDTFGRLRQYGPH